MVKKNKIFADSSYLIALFNTKDSLREKAFKIKNKIPVNEALFFINHLVFSEVVTILSQKTGKRNSVILGNKLLKDKELELIDCNKTSFKDFWSEFIKITKKDLSFANASILSTMKSEKIKYLVTFDRNLQREAIKRGFKVLK